MKNSEALPRGATRPWTTRYGIAWLLVPVILWFLAFYRGRYNNYKIFKYVFWNVVEGRSLFVPYPERYHDVNHYGPTFGLVIAPFAVLPDVMGGLLWCLAMALVLAWAILQLDLTREQKLLALALCSLELWDSIWSQQFNPAIAALVLLTYVDVEKGRDFRAPLWVLLGTFVKLYSVVGLVLVLFARDRRAFVLGSLAWSALLFAAPMAISSPTFVVQAYREWYVELATKHSQNVILHTSQDLSFMGLVRRAADRSIPSVWFYAVGVPFLLAPLLRRGQHRHPRFRLLFVASLLMFVVLFSSGSENTTYVICATGVAIWLAQQERPFRRRNVVLLVALLLVGLAPTDLLTPRVREWTDEYSIIALPYTVAWLLLSWELLTVDFSLRPRPALAAGAGGLAS